MITVYRARKGGPAPYRVFSASSSHPTPVSCVRSSPRRRRAIWCYFGNFPPTRLVYRTRSHGTASLLPVAATPSHQNVWLLIAIVRSFFKIAGQQSSYKLNISWNGSFFRLDQNHSLCSLNLNHPWDMMSAVAFRYVRSIPTPPLLALHDMCWLLSFHGGWILC